VRAEPGCLQFDPLTREDNPQHWVVFERYFDGAAFDAHISSDHSREFNRAIADHIVGGASSLVWLRNPAPEKL
jgi:quinol monooxygenase YgiN